MTRVSFAKSRLYELAHDIKMMLDQGVCEREVFLSACKRVHNDFRDVSGVVRVEWDFDSYKKLGKEPVEDDFDE